MSSLEDLQIDESNIELYTTSYVNVSNYKRLQMISQFSNAGYLYVYHSSDGKNDTISSTFLCNNKPSIHKIEVITDYIRICVSTMKPNELIDKVNINVKGRRAINSNLFNLLEKFQPVKEEEIILQEQNNKKEEKTGGIYKRLGIHTKPKEKDINKCKVPELLLKGHLLYCKENGRLEVLPPPVSDNKIYVLTMVNKMPCWVVNDEFQTHQAWFK